MSIAKKIIATAASVAIAVSAIPIASVLTGTESATVVSAAASGHREGFAYADGTMFKVDGAPYYYAGTNCYYLTYKNHDAVDNVFDDASAMGLKVIRTWGNIDCGVMTDQKTSDGYPVFTDSNDGDGQKDGYYFQYFDADLGKPVVNEGEYGLESLDYAIYQAEQHDMKLIITFTNYWDAFGGMGQYVKWAKQLGYSNLAKTDFYTNDLLKGWYKDYISTLLNHTNVYTGRQYKDEPAVFAWELANEPRCSTDPQAQNDVLYNWAKEMSEYVKSIDPDHMVSVGDEGFFNKPSGYYSDITTSSYPFYGAEGVDFEKLMTIETIDFGTPHLYLDQWALKFKDGEVQDDLLWFQIHGEYCAEIGKPVILEEFGLTDKTLRDTEYAQWFEVLEGKVYENVQYAGTNYWMIASYVDGALYPDYDNYTVYGPEGTVTESTRQLIMAHAKAMDYKCNANLIEADTNPYDKATASGDLTFTLKYYAGTVSGLEIDGETVPTSAYSVNGTTLTLSKSYLANVEPHTMNVKAYFTDANNPTCTVKITDSSITAAVITSGDMSYDKNSRVSSDTTITFEANGNTAKGAYIVKTGAALDCTVSDGAVVISAESLNALSVGTYDLAVDFTPGEDQTIKLVVSDSSSIDGVDDFDDYSSSDDLWNTYSRNTSGNEVGLALATKNGSQALAFTYNVGEPSYCGVNYPFTARDVSAFEGVQLWVEGDGSGNSLTIQVRDGNDKYFEKQITVDFTGGQTIQIPFSEFTAPSWQGDGTLDTTTINQFSIYAGNGGNVTTGTYYLDDIFFYCGDVVENPYLITTSGTATDDSDNVLVMMFLGSNKLSSISCNGTALTANVDYSWNGSQVTLNKSYLTSLAAGTYSLTFNFSDGSSDVFTLTKTGGTDVHTHSYTTTTVAATCTTNGSVTKTCECGDVVTEVIPATGHNYVAEVGSASCTTGGTIKYTCSNCGDTYTETIEAKGHSYVDTVVAATCEAEGYTTHTCSVCGDSYTDSYVAALGHNYVDTVVAPTTTTQGYTKHTCSNCGDTYTDNYVDPIVSDDAKETVLFSGSASCGYWGQAVSLNTVKNSGTLDPSVFTEGGYLAATITNGNASEARIILQSWSGGANWLTVKPSSVDGNTVKWTYADIVAAYGSNLSNLDRLHIAVENSNLTVSKVSYFGEGGDTPTPPTPTPDDDDDYQGKYHQYFYGSSSCGNWGQAVGEFTTKNGGSINPSDIVKSGYFYVEFTGDISKIELIFQSWSGGAGWLRMSPTETGTCSDGSYYAKWSYASLVEAYGSDFSTIDKVYVGASDGNITVYKLQYAY